MDESLWVYRLTAKLSILAKVWVWDGTKLVHTKLEILHVLAIFLAVTSTRWQDGIYSPVDLNHPTLSMCVFGSQQYVHCYYQFIVFERSLILYITSGIHVIYRKRIIYKKEDLETKVTAFV
jgi:hypothetical protein